MPGARCGRASRRACRRAPRRRCASRARSLRADTRSPGRRCRGAGRSPAAPDRSTNGRALLANDPHLDIGVPGIWYLLEGSAPGMHIGGAALAGTPGVTLGHNEHLAWGVTAGETAAMRVIREQARGADEFFENGRWVHAQHRHETIAVRFGASVDADILTTPHGVVIARGEQGGEAHRDRLVAVLRVH